MKKALYFEILNYKKENLDLLYDSFEIIRLNNPSMITPDILKGVSVIFAPLGYFFGEDIFSMSPNLKVVATNTTGVPHIDVERTAARGIHVISLKDEKEFLDTITPTAELTMGLIINITRNVIPAIKSVLDGKWSRWEFGGQAMLSRMSLGIVGLGRLGKMVARYATAFGMKVSYYDPFITHSELPPLCPPLVRGGWGGIKDEWNYRRTDTVEELVSDVDIISVHIPMNEENRHFFNKAVFSKFKKGSYFINTARGEIVDSQALIEALEKGIIKGAALDVLDGEFEPDFSNRMLSHPLIRYAQTHDNLIITPHIAGSTEDAWHLTQRHVIEQTIEYMRRFQ